jgi:spore coat protein U-like protein
MTSVDNFVAISGARAIRSPLRLLARSALFTMLAAVGVDALAVPTCTVAKGATLSFGAVVALASTGNVTTNSGTSFWVNCTADVTATPALYSASTRTLVSGGNTLPFTLSAAPAGGADLTMTSPGTVLGIAKNGTNQTVPLYGRITASDFKSLPSGFYAASITLTVEY